MRKKILTLVISLSIVFSGTSFAASPVITDGEGQSIMDVYKKLEDDILAMNEEVEDVARRIAEDEARILEIRMLAQLIEAEAGDQDLRGKMLVGNVVLNRVKSPAWPNDIYGVIHQRGQFEVMVNGAFNKAENHISDTSMEAARRSFTDVIDPGIMYFATYKANGKGFWKYGGHWFSY